MVSCILLAAGLSERFGSPKALVKLDGTNAIGLIQKSLADSKISEVIVVLGAHADPIKAHLLNHKKIRHVYNKDYNLGQTSSFKAGLEKISADSSGMMLLPVDFPWIKTKTINILVDAFVEKSPKILIPAYNGQRGHPPVFSKDLKNAILEMDNTAGLNMFEHQHESEVLVLPVDDSGTVETFNTPEEFEAILRGKK